MAKWHKCLCGCDSIIASDKFYVRGHNRLGKKSTELHKQRQSAALKGRPLSEEHCRKLSVAHMGIAQSEESRIKRSVALKGRPSPMKGRKQSPEARAKISAALKGPEKEQYVCGCSCGGFPHRGSKWVQGHHTRSKHHRAIMAVARSKQIGANHPWWRGGVSNRPPHLLWIGLQHKVRTRDKICRHCGASTSPNGNRLDVHHKDVNTMNNTLRNLIALCRSCHLKEHHRISKEVNCG